VKFLCDKCKTRYSIGDERVRGKILKIRCKNCANVITVREGMDIAPSEPRRNPTMAIQAIQVQETAPQPQAAARPQGALGAAFASQMTKPPPALEEEWYVSIDGNQAGPYSLAAAQRWVASKPFEAELHCWSEGFDDWLPVDKVSHFRNLRQRTEPARRSPTLPPPIPKVTPRGEEPKALFAATMASIEKSAGVAPEPQRPARPAMQAKGNAPARTNGAGAANTFKENPDAATQIDSPAFTNDDIATTAEPIAAKRVESKVPALGPPPDDEDDDNLEIGEVSRVVNLSDLAAMGTKKNATASNPAIGRGTQSNPALRATASSPSIRNTTASHPKLSPSELGMNVDPSLASVATPGAPMPDESLVARSFAERHRRGMMLLIGVSALLVIGVVAAVAFFMSNDDGDLPMGLGRAQTIDTSRPEDIVRRQLPPAPNERPTTSPTRPRVTRPANPLQPELPTEATGPNSKLDASEIEAMAAKYGEGTKRCYMRAQKGALGFEVADTKKIDVTLTVAPNGNVSEVLLSKHANNEFGQCLISRIKAWRFRESRGGTFRIALAFSAG
jgi:predicted Zn finger-like uncharacterized protein